MLHNNYRIGRLAESVDLVRIHDHTICKAAFLRRSQADKEVGAIDSVDT